MFWPLIQNSGEELLWVEARRRTNPTGAFANRDKRGVSPPSSSFLLFFFYVLFRLPELQLTPAPSPHANVFTHGAWTGLSQTAD